MIEIKRIDASNKEDINIPNEPFKIWGQMIPTYDGSSWSYTTKEFDKDQVTEMTFLDEDYNFKERSKDSYFVGAYKEGKCVGLAIYKHDWMKYLYLEDLKVNAAARGNGIATLLLQEGQKIAAENDYKGIFTIGQDNNLSACLFYVKSNFEIGGFNTHEYKGTPQEDKSNIYFYLDL